MYTQNKNFSSKPDYGISSSSQVDTADELVSFDKKMGGLSINQKTYKVFRFLGKFLGNILMPKPNTACVVITDNKNVSRGLLIVNPENQKGEGALFLIHGGGYVVGNYKDNLAYACDISRELGISVLSPAYGLGPENPFPCGINDLYESWQWLLDNASAFNINKEKIVIGGISAGGGIAAGLIQKIHDEGGTQPVAQLLIYPMLDDRVATKPELTERAHRVWNNVSNYFGWKSYLGREPGSEFIEYSVPGRRENLSGLPPAWIGVGTADLFLDEDRDYAKRLKDDGVDVSYVEVAGGIHAFDIANTQLGIDFKNEQREFLKKFIY